MPGYSLLHAVISYTAISFSDTQHNETCTAIIRFQSRIRGSRNDLDTAETSRFLRRQSRTGKGVSDQRTEVINPPQRPDPSQRVHKEGLQRSLLSFFWTRPLPRETQTAFPPKLAPLDGPYRTRHGTSLKIAIAPLQRALYVVTRAWGQGRPFQPM
jgi:hypothetical protein